MNSAHSYSEGAEVPEDKTDNELIAEFMDGFRLKIPRNMWYIRSINQTIDSDEMKYETSWDWLVPVARKFTEKAKHTDMPHAIFMNVYTFSVCGPIGELYENIIKGIKWYNQQKLKST